MVSPRLARALAWCQWYRHTGCWPAALETGRPPKPHAEGRDTPRGTDGSKFEIGESSSDSGLVLRSLSLVRPGSGKYK